MSSPDFRTFVSSLIDGPSGHAAWLSGHSAPSGDEFFTHYVGDPAHQDGLLWQYESWRSEHGYTEVRPWNGTEALARSVPAPEIPSPGTVLPWNTPGGPPFADAFLADSTGTAALQGHFGVGNTNALGAGIFAHWQAVRTFEFDGDIYEEDTAPYSIRFWGFMKWASVLRSRLLGIPVFAIPVVYDVDGVPLSDIEFMDVANRWHTVWHGGSACPLVTSEATDNAFAPAESPYGQFCGRRGQPGEFLRFHRNVLDTYDHWRRRAGMPLVARWRPDGLHFHGDFINGHTIDEVDLDDNNSTVEYQQIKDRVQHFNTLADLADFCEGDLHSAGHNAPESGDIADINTNNYSPRFFAWHRWIDYLWEVRQPRFTSFRHVASDGTTVDQILTVVRPTPNPDRNEPNNAVTSLIADGRGSLWVRYNVRPETWNRPINLTITAQVFRNSADLTPVAGLDATPVIVNAVAQGAESGAVELVFPGLEGGDGAFARVTLPGGAIAFKNQRIRITGHVVPQGNISTSFAAGNDTFEHDEVLDITLVRESNPPDVSTLLNKSAYSLDEIVVNAAGAAQSAFPNAFFVVLQDPPAAPPGLGTASIFADPEHTAVSGIFADLALKPAIDVVDELGNPVNWVTLVATDAFKENAALPDHVSQRVLFRYLAIFDVAQFTALLPNAGDTRYAQLRVTARDRAGNSVTNILSPRIKLFHQPHPYMIDVQGQNPSWLSIDTRVFSVAETASKFGHSVSASGSPSQYIKEVIGEFNGGTQDFSSIPAEEDQAPLELAPQENGVNVYNFALARVRMRTQAQVNDVRVFFRLFTTAVSNLSFTSENYPTTTGASPIALLGRTGGSEIVSIPFFADPRVETRDSMGGMSMSTQPDGANVQPFAVTPPGGETIRYFGVHLDINSNVPRFPQAPSGDGPFPTAQCVSIRDILRGQHQCMVGEVFFEPQDPTEPNTTPGTSDHLAQRNLLIVEAANPGEVTTHTAQHSFDLVLPTRKERDTVAAWSRLESEKTRRRVLSRANRANVAGARARDGAAFTEARTTATLFRSLERSSAVAALEMGQLAPDTVSRAPGITTGYEFGFDELIFFWNNIPKGSRVEVYLPSLPVEYVTFLRDRRGAPRTVRIVDANTLLLEVGEVTYLPIPSVGAGRVAGLVSVTLPDGIKAGELYRLDVMHVRPATGMVLGGFRLSIPVRKAQQMYRRAAALVPVFERRLAITPASNRWHPILARQLDYFKARATGLAQEAADECADGSAKGGRFRIIVEKIRILDASGPLVHGSGRVSFTARVTTTGGAGRMTRLPAAGSYPVREQFGGLVIDVGTEIYRGPLSGGLTVNIYSTEQDERDDHDRYLRRFTGKPTSWVGAYRPSDQMRDPENVGDWQVWYRIEQF